VRVLRTDLQGEVRLESDGERFSLTAARDARAPAGRAGEPRSSPGANGPAAGGPEARAHAPSHPGRYVAHRGVKVFHREDCRAVQRWAPEEREVFTRREQAAAGRRPAKDCKP
jgi:hypothetical protein